MNPKTVYVVHCVDTEGPLYESLEETFVRLNSILDLSVNPSAENLARIQRGELDLGGKEDAAQKIFAPSLINYNDTWDKVDDMLSTILSPDYRNKLTDSKGNGWRFSWFLLDHIGFDVNPRRRDIGYHNIFDHYRSALDQTRSQRDEIHWHFHPMSTYKEAHVCATSFLRSPHLLDVLARRILDRCWFPTCFRAGFHAERPDSHWFLEQWIPFDFSNQALAETTDDRIQSDVSRGRFGDWRRAIDDWSPYHPAHDDYQVEGSCNRTIFRCLNVGTRLRLLTQTEVDRAFQRADRGEPTVLAFTNHDFRDMRPDIERTHSMLSIAASKYPDVSWLHAGAKEAAQTVLSKKTCDPLSLEVEIELLESGAKRMIVSSSVCTFGPQPFLAVKTLDKRYLTDNFDFQEPGRTWSYTFDEQTIAPNSIDTIGVAATGDGGDCAVALYTPNGELRRMEYYA